MSLLNAYNNGVLRIEMLYVELFKVIPDVYLYYKEDLKFDTYFLTREKCKEIFEAVERMEECTLIHHHVNRGKGAALKTAIKYFLENRPDKEVVVTVDADGQHLVKDIEAVSCTSLKNKEVVF